MEKAKNTNLTQYTVFKNCQMEKQEFVYLTLARGPVLSKLILASGSSLEDLRVSEWEDTLLKRTL